MSRICGPTNTDGAPLRVPGIDVSEYQGTIDWDAVADAGVQFAIMRVSDGTSSPDDLFERNWLEARRVGITRGIYQYFRPAGDPVAQADLLLSNVDALGGFAPDDLPPVIDIESNGGRSPAQVVDAAQAWIDRVAEATGEVPLVYTAAYFADDHGLGAAFGELPLWVANYTTNPCPWVPDGWAAWRIWQYSDNGTVSGIDGPVDLNHFGGTVAELRGLATLSRTAPAWWCPALASASEAGVLLGDCATLNRESVVSRGELLGLLRPLLRLDETAAAAACPLPFVDLAARSAEDRAAAAALAALTWSDGPAAVDADAGRFRPDEPMSRCELARLGWTALRRPAGSSALPWSDADAIAADCAAALPALLDAGLVRPSSERFGGNDDATPGDIAWFAAAWGRRGGEALPDAAFEAACVATCTPVCAACVDGPVDDGCGGACPLTCDGSCIAGGCEARSGTGDWCDVCVVDGDCRADRICLGVADATNRAASCVARCASSADCRDDHRCIAGVCAPETARICGADGQPALLNACGVLVPDARLRCDVNERCEAGECVAFCESTCPREGETTCAGNRTMRICEVSGEGPCLAWSANVTCDAGEVCLGGACGPAPDAGADGGADTQGGDTGSDAAADTGVAGDATASRDEGCSTAPGSAAWWWLAVPVLLRRRRAA